MKYLSEEFSKNKAEDQLEELIYDGNIIFDKGYYIEVYCNLDGKYDEDSSNGASTFIYLDEEITYNDLIKLFQGDGSVKDDTMTINIISDNDPLYSQERDFCKDNFISRLKSKLL